LTIFYILIFVKKANKSYKFEGVEVAQGILDLLSSSAPQLEKIIYLDNRVVIYIRDPTTALNLTTLKCLKYFYVDIKAITADNVSHLFNICYT
jgi:hypothetical protein